MTIAGPIQAASREGLDADPFWYKTGVIYEVHVRAFCDSDGNGAGDFRGLTSKLDYLKDLGVTARTISGPSAARRICAACG